jgi:hypothetical protein
MCAGLALAAPAAWGQPPESQSIVSIRVTAQSFDPITPWVKLAEQNVSGSGLVVEGRRLLTTADLVKNANLIEVRKSGRYPDYQARAVLVDYELNLALLEVGVPSFWDDLKVLPLAQRVGPASTFTINRWRPNGRFEQGTGELVDYGVGSSRFGTAEFPVMRGTTSMSGLGWAEVMTSGGIVTGLLTSHDNQQIEATPASLLTLFIRASRQFPYAGFAQRGFAWQQLNHPALRASYGLPENSPGVLIRRVHAGGTGAGQLRPGDILTRVGPYTIDPEGQIEHPNFGQMLFTIAINESLDEALPVEIVREGKPKSLKLRRQRLTPLDYRVIPYVFDRSVEYEVQGGLVLQELTLSYLRAWGKNWPERAPARLAIEAIMNPLRDPGKAPERVVFVSKILPDPVNLGYEDLPNAIVIRANGRPVVTLTDFREALQNPIDGFDVVEFMPGQGRAKLVFKADTLAVANQRIRERYEIPRPLSPVPAQASRGR